MIWFGLVIALCPQTPKHMRGGWSHYTDTSEPVDGNGAQNMVTVQSGFEPATFRSLALEFTNCSNKTHTLILRGKKNKQKKKQTKTRKDKSQTYQTQERQTTANVEQEGNGSKLPCLPLNSDDEANTVRFEKSARHNAIFSIVLSVPVKNRTD
jgi:hypothetical protein